MVHKKYAIMSTMDEKKKRFNQLLEDYAVALHIADQLFDSGLIEKKVKVKDYELFNADFVSRLAYEMREARKRARAIINEPSNGIEIANAYFVELSARGSEWNHADLADLFDDLRETSKELAERDIEWPR